MTFDFAIVDCLVERDGKYLLIQESKPGREGLYNLPGGHLDDIETIAEAAVREVEEESGYRVELTGFIGLYQTILPEKQLNVAGPVFLGKVTGGQASVSAEHPEVRWVTAEELLGLAKAGKFWTSYPPDMIRDYLRRGAYPLDAVVSKRLAVKVTPAI
jgi:8-oxo-dGTP pyrophosphatase MutT (NUDIX family)